MKIYLAHSMRLYNTKTEKVIYQILESMYNNFNGEVVCPNRDSNTVIGNIRGLSGREIMDRCLAFVETVDMVVVATMNGYIPKGCYEEVKHALDLGIGVVAIHLSSDSIIINDVNEGDVMVNDPNDWKYKYAKLERSYSMMLAGVAIIRDNGTIPVYEDMDFTLAEALA